MKSLEDSRRRIDEIDTELVKLFEERMNTVTDVANYKKEHKIDILNTNREAEVVENAINNLKDKKYSEEVADFFNHLMDISKNFQRKTIAKKAVNYIKESLYIDIKESANEVGYIKNAGEITFKALSSYFCDIKSSVYNTLENMLDALVSENIDYTFLVFDNSIEGNLSRLFEFLEKYPDIYIKDKGLVDNQGKIVKDMHGAESDNYNKFIVLGKYKRFVKDCNKVDLIIRIDNEPKSLGHLVKFFSNYNVNINKIDSREVDSTVKTFTVFINFDGCLEDKNILKMLSGLEGDVPYLRLVGAYKG